MNFTPEIIYVYAHWSPLPTPQPFGELRVIQTRGKELFSFTYSGQWLQSGFNYTLDPDLMLFEGPQFPQDEKTNFGLFLDSSPDRWGRVLMQRREAILAMHQKRKPQKLTESHYLLGVHDETRLGALRFATSPDGPFLSQETELSCPPIASLRDLEYASLQLERTERDDTSHYEKWVNQLIDPGSSLGGARPKASVRETNDTLWIAKFPSSHDQYDVGAWEMVIHDLAFHSGINIAESKIVRLSSHHHTYVTKRFDRIGDNKRIHFASAMNLLGYTDSLSRTQPISYLEIAEFIIQHGAEANKDLKELWKRIVFSICVSNTDDHLRNHGFILTNKGWVLSPAYDVNPIPNSSGLNLNITEFDNSLNLKLAVEVIPYFRLEQKEAFSIIEKVQDITATWRSIAHTYHIPKSEQDYMDSAFNPHR